MLRRKNLRDKIENEKMKAERWCMEGDLKSPPRVAVRGSPLPRQWLACMNTCHACKAPLMHNMFHACRHSTQNDLHAQRPIRHSK